MKCKSINIVETTFRRMVSIVSIPFNSAEKIWHKTQQAYSSWKIYNRQDLDDVNEAGCIYMVETEPELEHSFLLASPPRTTTCPLLLWSCEAYIMWVFFWRALRFFWCPPVFWMESSGPSDVFSAPQEKQFLLKCDTGNSLNGSSFLSSGNYN